MIKKCKKCNSYTLQSRHCGKETEEARPPKFSFPDHYGKYRRKTKKQSQGVKKHGKDKN